MGDELTEYRGLPFWDKEWDLPLFPAHNNPHFLCAIFAQLLGDKGNLIRERYKSYLTACESPSGYIRRRPRGERTSHDEWMGAAKLNKDFANRSLDFAKRTDGFWTDEEPPAARDYAERFIFLLPFVRSCAGEYLSFVSEFKWACHIANAARKPDGANLSGALKIWLMMPEARKYPMTALACMLFERRWTKAGWTPKRIFTEVMYKEYPVLGQLAREDWK